MNPKLQFLGGVGTVTGSKFLYESDGGHRILIDCGIFQGLKELRLQNWADLPIPAGSIDAVILTHAHLDHTGYLPLLVKQGFTGEIYCSAPTRELTKLILMDSAGIQEEDAQLANTGGYSKHRPAQPLYTTRDVHQLVRQLKAVECDKWIKLPSDVKFRLSHSGHILGSSFVELNSHGLRTVFSGDLGRQHPLLMPAPATIEAADYLLIESTYGDRTHQGGSAIKRLEKLVNETVARGGHLIIPSFAVGRAQDVLYLLTKLKRERLIPELPVYLDSPMGIRATEVFLDYPEWHSLGAREAKEICESVVMVNSPQQSAEIARAHSPTIVIAGSGMVSGGRVLHHLERRLPDERNTVLLVGFQAAGTRGRLLRDGINELKMRGQYVAVHAHIEEIASLSAHADQTEILAWLKGFRTPPRKTFIVHGEPQASDALRVRIRDTLGWEATVPHQFDIVPLD